MWLEWSCHVLECKRGRLLVVVFCKMKTGWLNIFTCCGNLNHEKNIIKPISSLIHQILPAVGKKRFKSYNIFFIAKELFRQQAYIKLKSCSVKIK